MPPRTRTRATKALKENVDVAKKNKAKMDGKISKPPRQALADKTNSLSDDNASIDVPVKTSKKVLKSKDEKSRPRRDRRLPPRYNENVTLKNLSNNKESPVKLAPVTSKAKTQIKQSAKKDLLLNSSQNVKNQNSDKSSADVKDTITQAKPKAKDITTQLTKSEKASDKQVPITKYLSNSKNAQASRQRRNRNKQPIIEISQDSLNNSSPFKSPSKVLESSLVANRPKRIHRLPSRFEDHSLSPNKFVPVQPCHASTPLQQKNTKTINKNTPNTSHSDKNVVQIAKTIEKLVSKSKGLKAVNKVNTSTSSIEKTSPDSNNNGKKNSRPIRATVKAKLQTKQTNTKPSKVIPFAKRLIDKSLSFQVLGDNKFDNKDDVYEFTFDPNDEPTPQKKKRKRPVKKRPPKTKKVVFKSNYDDNVSKALENLKNRVKLSQTGSVQSNDTNLKTVDNQVTPSENQNKTIQNHVNINKNIVNPLVNHAKPLLNHAKPIENVPNIQKTAEINNNLPQSNYSANITPAIPINDTATSIHASNYASIRVEDIAADFELSQDDINYSPVNSPHQKPCEPPETQKQTSVIAINDPLNLQEGTSFFEDPPVASSSMNMSARQPIASPWRVEFESLPMRWHNNTYVKPNMTPAVECSFINSEQATKKRHVYTNMLPNEPLPEIFDNPAPALKQTSIISFIKEVVEKKNKKKRRRSPSPVKTNTIFEDINGTTSEIQKTPNKKAKIADSTPNTSNNSNNSKDKENSTNSSHKSLSPQKKQKKKDQDCTYFGFDDSDNLEQENVSPQKQNKNSQSMKTRTLRSRNVLQELNTQPLPTRGILPVNPKSKLASSEIVEQLYDQLKSTENAQLPATDNAKEPNTVATDLDGPSIFDDNDSQSVHLFEDVEVVHHLKPHRKSYGKAKKVTFVQTADSDSDTQPAAVDPGRSSDEDDLDDLADLSFHLPDFKEKKKVKKKKAKKLLTKKEEKKVEEWAAGFNSMCEDIDEFPLVVEYK